MARLKLGADVFTTAVERLQTLYEAGHRLVLSFSAGKDSGVCLELCILAARAAGRLPVEVVMQDEEIAYPGTYEYAERTAARPEVSFHWLIMNQPMVNVFNRAEPYWWVFDPLLEPEQWVRQPPAIAYKVPEQNITDISTTRRFPPAPGKDLIQVIGIRTQESRIRKMSIHSAGGHITSARSGSRKCKPIFDWTDGDVWRAVRDHGWDYNSAYDTLFRLGVPRSRLRVGPPTMARWTVNTLNAAQRAWPRWFDRVATRVPGIRSAALFGVRAVSPHRRPGESWQRCFVRECIEEAPAEWIRERSVRVRDYYTNQHAHHATTPFPEVVQCPHCNAGNGSWKSLALAMYNGNPYSLKMEGVLPYVEPEFFRPGAGTWGGKPTW